MSPQPCIALIGTCDTKLDELLYLHKEIACSGATVLLIDVGRQPVQHESIDIDQTRLLKEYGDSQVVGDLPRGEVIKTMAACATKAVKELHAEGRIHAIISAGGSGGTALAAQVMRDALPIGFPKLIVSTVASGDTGPIVGETDITLMNSVVDIAGLNHILRRVLSNAGHAIAAMSCGYVSNADTDDREMNRKKSVGITMFGVTTPAVDTIRKHLDTNYDIEVYVFHATGHGGKAMERLVRDGELDAVLDLTTTEICDHITGGVMSAGPHRLQAAAEARIPNIISLGATDMTNFGPKNTVPERYQDRRLYEHNSFVTLMRTSKEEAQQVGKFIAGQLSRHTEDPNTTQVWLPRGGISMLAVPSGPFANEEADSALFAAIKEGLTDSGIKVVEDARAINDDSFARDIAEALVTKMGIQMTGN